MDFSLLENSRIASSQPIICTRMNLELYIVCVWAESTEKGRGLQTPLIRIFWKKNQIWFVDIYTLFKFIRFDSNFLTEGRKDTPCKKLLYFLSDIENCDCYRFDLRSRYVSIHSIFYSVYSLLLSTIYYIITTTIIT